jgi:seryl-tRNA synthetase
MLDLGYVREHLPEVEERLRQRGLNSDELLGGFRDLDARRREAITTAETLKAERNKKSEEVGRRKRAGEDAAALMEETKSLREEGERQEKLAAQLEEELRTVMSQIPNLPHSSVPAGRTEHDNVEARRWGAPPKFSFTAKPHWELGTTRSARPGARCQALRRAICGVLGPGGKA